MFILQAEGSKRWQVYKPLPDQILPRVSSRDFTPDEIGPPILDVVLKPGDLLYLPRGTIHQAQSLPGTHSLHITVSANQKRTWVDFLETALQYGLRELETVSLAARMALPLDYFDYMGLMYADTDDADVMVDAEDGMGNRAQTGALAFGSGEVVTSVSHVEPGDETRGTARERVEGRRAFRVTAKALMSRLADVLLLDDVSDELCCNLLRQRLPPYGLPARPSPPADTLPHDVVLRCFALLLLASPYVHVFYNRAVSI